MLPLDAIFQKFAAEKSDDLRNVQKLRNEGCLENYTNLPAVVYFIDSTQEHNYTQPGRSVCVDTLLCGL